MQNLIFGRESGKKKKKGKTLSERFYKMVFFLGLAIAYRGLKGMIRAKGKRVMHRR